MRSDEYKDRKYSVRAYDPAWPGEFEVEERALRKIFGVSALAVEHIGSTSVPGMDGKPTVDILVLVDDVSAANEHAAAMKEAGYEYLPEYVMPGSALFRRKRDNVLLSNVHVFPKDHPHVREMLGVRDYLRSHPDEARAYADLKRELFRKYPDDYAAYRKFKDAYMEDLKRRAYGAQERQV